MRFSRNPAHNVGRYGASFSGNGSEISDSRTVGDDVVLARELIEDELDGTAEEFDREAFALWPEQG